MNPKVDYLANEFKIACAIYKIQYIDRNLDNVTLKVIHKEVKPMLFTLDVTRVLLKTLTDWGLVRLELNKSNMERVFRINIESLQSIKEIYNNYYKD